MDILIQTILAGFAVGYTVEFIGSLIERWIPIKAIRLSLTLPLNVVALMTLGFNGAELFVLAPAGGFVALVIMMGVSKPVEVQQVSLRR